MKNVSWYLFVFMTLSLNVLNGQYGGKAPDDLTSVKVISDTVYYSHSKYSPIDYGCKINRYVISNDDFELIKKYEKVNRYDDNKRDSILKKYNCLSHELIPSAYEGNAKWFDPFSLFCIKIFNEYKFGNPFLVYKIERTELLYGIRLKELVPNASKHFRNPTMKISFYNDDCLVKMKKFESEIGPIELKSIFPGAFDYFEIHVINKLDDCLKVRFIVSTD